MDEAIVLLKKCEKGDTEAFEILYIKYKLLIFRNALLMFGDKQRAEDVLQDVFITIWKSAGKFDPQKAKFTTWLHKITMNRCIDYYRKERANILDYDSDITELASSRKNDLPEEILINKLEYERLIRAIKYLDVKHRSTLILRFFNDLSYKEISDVLSIPLGTVKSRIHQALCMLRKQMELPTSEISIKEMK